MRNKKFKVIPSIRKGSWVVKKAVGQKPAIIGKALTTTYHEAKNQYLEVDIDVNSSKIAQFMMGVVKGAAKDFVIDIGFLIESQEEDELPEMLLGTVRLARYTAPFTPIVSLKLLRWRVYTEPCVCCYVLTNPTRPDVDKFATLPYAPIADSQWKKQQKNANISTK